MEHKKQLEYACYDTETKYYINLMCRKCKFYNNGCEKNRIIRKCAEQGLKNKD